MENHMIRIQEMEAILNESDQLFEEAEHILNNISLHQEKFQRLMNYYFGEEYKEDLSKDKAGQIPDNIPRGVLSEDAVHDLFIRQRELSFFMLKLATRLLETPY